MRITKICFIVFISISFIIPFQLFADNAKNEDDLYDKKKEQIKRFDRLLSKWEQQAELQDRILGESLRRLNETKKLQGEYAKQLKVYREYNLREGVIVGKVLLNHEPVEGIKVYLGYPGTTRRKIEEVITDKNGLYKFEKILFGEYSIWIHEDKPYGYWMSRKIVLDSEKETVTITSIDIFGNGLIKPEPYQIFTEVISNENPIRFECSKYLEDAEYIFCIYKLAGDYSDTNVLWQSVQVKDPYFEFDGKIQKDKMIDSGIYRACVRVIYKDVYCGSKMHYFAINYNNEDASIRSRLNQMEFRNK